MHPRTSRRLRALGGLAALVAALAVPVPAADAAAKPRCGGLRATIVGTSGDDVLRGTRGKDVIVGRGGDDRILGRGGRDVICGGGGKDVIVSGSTGGSRLLGEGGADRVAGNGAGDRVEGGVGNDVLQTTARGVTITGGAGDDRLTGGAYDDRLDGGPGDDALHGGAGSDILHGDDGADRLWTDGGVGDQVWGDAGNDALVADAARAQLIGGAGDDLLRAQAAGVLLLGGDGDDQLDGADAPGAADGGFGDDLILLGDGDDADVHGGPGNDEIDGGGGDDVLDADDGVDTCRGGPGADTCHGGAPEGPENTPGDPDRCDAEEQISCRAGALPARWRVHLEGTAVHTVGDSDQTTTVWSLTGEVVSTLAQDGVTWYFLGAGLSGTWHAEGHSQYCTINGSGPLEDGDLSFVLALDEPGRAYRFQWGGLADLTATATCPWGEEPHQVHADTQGEVVADWNPADLATPLAGHQDSQSGEADDTLAYTWTITPLD
ncbi:calcium-binding protein [Nocardioides daeguensis]|uniref:Calcium-binding protein n=1 Tax=Nocardioides daeguensis TaxID=908359 RepID=A0ABP6UZ64_9ACTN|nr:calcium-binding protein [Nocardioides daeguensis]MBV6725990.1 hypothetical protein [Nocardioides daeguensis]MCR1772494.1 hypothetical protein [Nocardioides daeguensis]